MLVLVLDTNFEPNRTMAEVVPPGGFPPVPVMVPYLPFAAGNPGTITGWFCNATWTETLRSTSRERRKEGRNHLVTNIPDFSNAGHYEAMRAMADEITNNNDTLIPYLVASNTIHGEVCSTVLHSIQ
jgi:hypothetical protein